MCNCINKSAFNKSFIEKVSPESANWADIRGLKKHKIWIDEKYRDLEEILDNYIAKTDEKEGVVSENTGKHIHKNLEDV